MLAADATIHGLTGLCRPVSTTQKGSTGNLVREQDVLSSFALDFESNTWRRC